MKRILDATKIANEASPCNGLGSIVQVERLCDSNIPSSLYVVKYRPCGLPICVSWYLGMPEAAIPITCRLKTNQSGCELSASVPDCNSAHTKQWCSIQSIKFHRTIMLFTIHLWLSTELKTTWQACMVLWAPSSPLGGVWDFNRRYRSAGTKWRRVQGPLLYNMEKNCVYKISKCWKTVDPPGK